MAIAAFAHRPSHPLGFAPCSIRFIVCSPFTALTHSRRPRIARASAGDIAGDRRHRPNHAQSRRTPTTTRNHLSPEWLVALRKEIDDVTAFRFLVEALAQKTSVACCLCRSTV